MDFLGGWSRSGEGKERLWHSNVKADTQRVSMRDLGDIPFLLLKEKKIASSDGSGCNIEESRG